MQVLEGRWKPRVSGYLFVVILIGCSSWDERAAGVDYTPDYTPEQMPSLAEIDEARRQDSEATEQLKLPVQALHDCYFLYVRVHALAATAPADIIGAARVGCHTEAQLLRSAVQLHLLASTKVNSLTREGKTRSAGEIARLAENVVDNRLDEMEPTALELIVRLRTPAAPQD